MTLSASASSEGHSAADARITSGSSWCAPVSDDQHHLQINLRTLHLVFYVTTYGDSTSPKWVITYNVNYTVDYLNWKTLPQVRKMGIANMHVLKSNTATFVVHVVSLTILCRYIKETKMPTIM